MFARKSARGRSRSLTPRAARLAGYFSRRGVAASCGSPKLHTKAFTLVEMLVAVGLVALMPGLFTTIFQMATGLPREFIGIHFIGRFTQEETSFVNASNADVSFGYPTRISASAPNPAIRRRR